MPSPIDHLDPTVPDHATVLIDILCSVTLEDLSVDVLSDPQAWADLRNTLLDAKMDSVATSDTVRFANMAKVFHSPPLL